MMNSADSLRLWHHFLNDFYDSLRLWHDRLRDCYDSLRLWKLS